MIFRRTIYAALLVGLLSGLLLSALQRPIYPQVSVLQRFYWR